MEIKKITDLIENFAPLELQEAWDCSGFQIYKGGLGNPPYDDVNKILLCLSVTLDIVNQAIKNNCDMIIAHHPRFFIPLEFNKNIPIYSVHTNLDKADGGTTDTLVDVLGFSKAQKIGDFLRLIDLEKEIPLDTFINILKSKLNLSNVRIVNNFKKDKIKKIAFCAGSGADLLCEAEQIGADIFVTGDVKFHTALESNVIIADIGHFESEIPVIKRVKSLLGNELEVIIADEESPFINC